jgi:hypothetical protein
MRLKTMNDTNKNLTTKQQLIDGIKTALNFESISWTEKEIIDLIDEIHPEINKR